MIICGCVFVHIIKLGINIYRYTWRMHVHASDAFQSDNIIRAAQDFQRVYQCCVSVPGLLSGGSWQTSPAGCCVRPVPQRRPSTPAQAVLRSAGSAGRRSGPTPGAGSLRT